MATKNLKCFMRPQTKEVTVLTVPGPESIKDEKGEVINLEIRKLHQKKITEINEMYKTKTPLKDGKKGFVVQNGEVVFKVEKDSTRAFRHVMVEALAYPDLKDPELMKFYECVDVTEMPLLVFPESDEYSYVTKKVMEVLGLADPEEEEQKKEVDEAKN